MSTPSVNVNVEELKGFLGHIVKNNRHLQKQGKTPVAVNVEGDAGLGKTSAVIQLSEELGLNCVRLNLATIEELGDLVGFPVRQFELCKKGSAVKQETKQEKVIQEVTENRTVKKQVTDADGKLVMKDVMVPVVVKKEVLVPINAVETTEDTCLWIDEQAIEEYTKQGYSFTGQKRMTYCPPEWITGLTGGGFLILDDYSRADIRFIQACMTLIETQKYISWSLPQDWHIILTTNPDNGEYLVTPMDTAQKTRFISVVLKFDIEVWAAWAEKQQIDSRCINFLLLHPELVKDSVNPRSITTFFNSISSIPDFASNLPLIQMIGEGSVGDEFSTLFNIFINNKLDKLVSPKDILSHDNEAHILGELRNCIGRDDDYRADIASILTTRLINYATIYAENNPITPAMIKRLITLTTDPDTIKDDLKYIIVKKLINCPNKQKFQSIMTNDQVLKMTVR